MTQHASDCAVHNAPAMEPGPCDCGANEGLAPSKDESRRACALGMAIEACDHISDEEDATYIIETAKTFETYLKGA